MEQKATFQREDFRHFVGHPSEAFDELVKAVRAFGLFVYSDPECSDSSDCGFILSKRKLNGSEIRKVSRLLWKQ